MSSEKLCKKAKSSLTLDVRSPLQASRQFSFRLLALMLITLTLEKCSSYTHLSHIFQLSEKGLIKTCIWYNILWLWKKEGNSIIEPSLPVIKRYLAHSHRMCALSSCWTYFTSVTNKIQEHAV